VEAYITCAKEGFPSWPLLDHVKIKCNGMSQAEKIDYITKMTPCIQRETEKAGPEAKRKLQEMGMRMMRDPEGYMHEMLVQTYACYETIFA
jgi:hypothetical protein